MPTKPEDTLTPQEFEAVRALAESRGESNAELAEQMHVHPDSVKRWIAEEPEPA
jgi:DNA-binding MarR family transcriptional regulator